MRANLSTPEDRMGGDERGLTRTRIAERLGIGIGTLLYYERIGLLDPPERTANGYRIYSSRDLGRLKLIAKAKSLGFSLKEIDALVKGLAGGLGEKELRSGLLEKAAALEREVAELEERRRAILAMAASPVLGGCETIKAAYG